MRFLICLLVFLAVSGPITITGADLKSSESGEEITPDVTLVGAEFGMVKLDKDGNPQIIPATVIPLVKGQAYGWRLRFRTERKILALREELALPAIPGEWTSKGGKPVSKVSPDLKTATKEVMALLKDGMLQNVWSVIDGDPSGDYEIRLTIEGQLVRTFKFKVEPPK